SAGVAPGELIQIAGQKLGPATKVMAQLDSSNRLPFSVAGTAVTFDGIAAPLISVQDGAIVCFVPFAVSAATEVTVKSSAGQSNAVRVPVSPAQPEILAIANQDGTPNSANNPAAQGSVITVYVSGLGQTNPPGVDGQVNAAPAAVPLAPVTVYVAGMPAMPQYVAAAVGLVAGISQVNVQVPSGKYPPTNSVSVNQAFAPLYIAAQ
ncbi:MAG TPA: hypothetical protein VGS58_16710, partial [Candidatus Sulfopaludibacter sp.]|nr:hypothetical protein [Candidatus Sulfopaludibacter sp.]